jgi:hypothetical protein
LQIVTTTDQSNYSQGQPVVMTTTLTDINTCIFQPAKVGEYSCPMSLVAQMATGAQVYPSPGQDEQCRTPVATTLHPGASDMLSATWNGQVANGGTTQNAPPGSYQAIGTWGWSAGQGQPAYSVNVQSPAFTIS